MRERTIDVRDDRRWCVVTHGADGFLGVFDHWRQDEFHVFHGETGGELAAAQLVRIEGDRLFSRADHRLELFHVFEPFKIRVLVCKLGNDFLVLVELVFLKVGCDHAARLDAALADNDVLIERAHAGFRADSKDIVLCERIAHRAETIPVETGDGPATIKGGYGGRAVPRLHDGVTIAVKRCVGVRHDAVTLGPGFRQKEGFGHWRGASGLHQNLEHGVERRRVRGASLNDRLQVFLMAFKRVGDHTDFVRLHPVGIAANRVDLTIVGEHAEGLSQPPLREGVGGIALVIDRDGRDETFVLKVRIEFVDVLGEEHAFIDQVPL